MVSRIFKFIGVGRALFIHPTVALASYLVMLRAPSFEAIRYLKIADNSINYSLGNTAMQALWLPTSRETKYRAKQAVDSFCVRAGDVLQAGVVYTGELTALTVSGFAAVNVVFVSGWLAVVAGLRDACTPRPTRAVGRSSDLEDDDAEILRVGHRLSDTVIDGGGGVRCPIALRRITYRQRGSLHDHPTGEASGDPSHEPSRVQHRQALR